MNRPLLNDDILLHIIDSYGSTAGHRAVCALMRTSRLFHHAGARPLLENGVYLRSNKHLESFIHFMVADGDYRFLLLRTLSISTETLTPFVGYALAMLFHRIARKGALSSLMLVSSEDILRSHPELPYAVAEVPTLKSLTMYNVGPRAKTLLKHLRSELVYADVQLPASRSSHATDEEEEEDREEDEEVALDIRGDDLTALLEGSCNSLRQLRVSCAARNRRDIDKVVFPNVTVLTLSSGHIDESYTGRYAVAFPRLQELYSCDFDFDDTELDSEDFYTQSYYNKLDQHEFGTWDSLRFYEGTLAMLHDLAIDCPISWLKLDTSDLEFEPDMLSNVFFDNRPVHLSLSGFGARFFVDEWFLQAFDGMNTLETLMFLVCIDEDDEHLDAHEFLDAVTAIVAKIPTLIEFQILLQNDSSDMGSLDEDDVPFSMALEEVDIDEFAKQLVRVSAASSGSLTSVAIRGLSRCSLGQNPGEVGSPSRSFDCAYKKKCRKYNRWSEEERKAWSGVRRLLPS